MNTQNESINKINEKLLVKFESTKESASKNLNIDKLAQLPSEIKQEITNISSDIEKLFSKGTEQNFKYAFVNAKR